MLNGAAFNANSTDIAASLHRQLGAEWIHLDWDSEKPSTGQTSADSKSPSSLPLPGQSSANSQSLSLATLPGETTILNLVQFYLDGKLPVLLTTHSISQAKAAHKRFGSKIEIAYKNEPDNNELSDYCGMEDLVILLRHLYERGIKVVGPNFSHWRSPEPRWDTRQAWRDFKAFGGLKYVSKVGMHLYDWNPEDMPRIVKEIRGEIGSLPLIVTEWGPSPAIKDEKMRADWFLRAQRMSKSLGIPASLYRIADVGDASGLVSNAGFSRPWELNGAGKALVGMREVADAAAGVTL